MPELTKGCRKCGLQKELYSFHKKADNRDGFSNVCKSCHKEIMHQHYLVATNSGVADMRRKKYLSITKKIISDFKTSGCVVCGETTPVCLDAHHRNPNEKDTYFADGICSAHVGPKRLKLELAKCICVCSNCHRKIHAKIINIESIV